MVNPPECGKPEESFQVNTEDKMAADRRISLFPGGAENTRKIIINSGVADGVLELESASLDCM